MAAIEKKPEKFPLQFHLICHMKRGSLLHINKHAQS